MKKRLCSLSRKEGSWLEEEDGLTWYWYRVSYPRSRSIPLFSQVSLSLWPFDVYKFILWMESYTANPKLWARCGHPPFFFLDKRGIQTTVCARTHCLRQHFLLDLCRRGVKWTEKGRLNWIGNALLSVTVSPSERGGRKKKKPHRAHKHLGGNMMSISWEKNTSHLNR